MKLGLVQRVVLSKTATKESQFFRSFTDRGDLKALEPKEGINWGDLSFSLTPTEYMYVSKCKQGTTFQKGSIIPYGPLDILPSATVLNYGQSIFEGIKAFRSAKGRCVVFRPDQNARRFAKGADRFLMPPVAEEVFIDAINKVVKSNSNYIPPTGQGALYLRPLLFGSGPQLGVAPSNEYTFCIFASPVGNYFKGGLTTIDLLVTDIHRAAPRGSGFVKAAGNYAPAFQAQKAAKEQKYSEVLFLDAKEDKYIEEAGASNIFVLGRDGVLYTPELGSILDGVTRKSLIQIAKDKGVTVKETKVSIDLAMDAKEVFCSGTGASIAPVGSITYKGRKAIFNNQQVGPLTKDLYTTILDIQFERIPDTYGWIHHPWDAKK